MLSDLDAAWPDREVIDLSKEQLGSKAIKFLRIELPGGWYRPFALVHYAEDGEEQQYGLRLDRDKGVFLDHLSNRHKDEFVQSKVQQILQILLEHTPERREQTEHLNHPRNIDLGGLPSDFWRRAAKLGVELRRVELHGGWDSRFGLIQYANEAGEEPKYGVRIDLDKGTLLDRVEDEHLDEFFRSAVPQILSLVRESILIAG